MAALRYVSRKRTSLRSGTNLKRSIWIRYFLSWSLGSRCSEGGTATVRVPSARV